MIVSDQAKNFQAAYTCLLWLHLHRLNDPEYAGSGSKVKWFFNAPRARGGAGSTSKWCISSFMKSYVWQIWPTCQELSPMKQLTWRMARLLKLHPERDRRVRSVHIELFDSKRNKWVTITKQSIRHIARWKLCFIMQSKRLFRSKRRPRLLPRLLRPIVSIQTRLSICLKTSLLQCYMTLVITYLIDILPCNHCLFHIH